MKLTESFYQRSDVTVVARDLLGKVLFTSARGRISAGIIVETEAYSQLEKGSHAYRGVTERNKIMYGPGGAAYVYLCYGIHHLFNVVTNVEEIADAVLIRAIEPYRGEQIMKGRVKTDSFKRIGSGPGKLTKALGINRSHNGLDLMDDKVWIEDVGTKLTTREIKARTRIGIDYAGKDKWLPWRFLIHGNAWVSKP